MFFLKYLTREILIHPSFFSASIPQRLRQKLHEDLEGTCTGEFFIICIIDLLSISPGKIRPGTGEASYTVSYRAIIYKPFRGETVEASVESVKVQGVFCKVGQMTVFVSKWHLPQGMVYRGDGAAPVFGDNEGMVIERGSAVRVRILGMRSDVNVIQCVGRMDGGWFGLAPAP